MPVSVFLADLRHDFAGVLANDCMPLGVAYMKAVLDRDLPQVESRLFAYPHRLQAALEDCPPDVLLLSNYMWNEALSLRFARLAKRLRPSTLVVMGGPNLPLEEARQIAYLRAHPELDVYALGEGELLSREIVRRYCEVGPGLTKPGAPEIPSSIFRRLDGTIVSTSMWERQGELEEIPSPWLTGVLDEFFDGKLAPLLETNRGCPFTCTFCVQGVRWYTKVHNFSVDRIRSEIEYIGQRIREVSPTTGFLRIADSNFGMFERDADIATAIGRAQQAYGWPTYIDATTGKNRPERVIEALERVNGALVLYQSVQSLDEGTLRNIKRQNIKNDAYETLMVHVRGRGLRSLSDLILGLPGETLRSHIESIHKLVDCGTNEMHNFQAMLLKGSELESVGSREKYGFVSRFRVLPKNYGVYADERVFDVDEIIVETATMSFEDYIEARKYHLVCSIFWNNSWFQDVLDFAKRFDVKPSQWLDAMLHELTSDPELRQLLEQFVAATRNELFPTREACVDFYSKDENFQRLRRGEIGDNLMYRFRALASFFLWPQVCAAALRGTRRLLDRLDAESTIDGFDALWRDFATFVEESHAWGESSDAILSPDQAPMGHDIAAWIQDGMPFDVSPYRLAELESFEFALPAESERELAACLKVWSTSLVGLTKGVTRVRAEAQRRIVRRCVATAREERQAFVHP